MHVFFSGIGGAGIGPLALIAHQAGFKVSGSDKQDSAYINYLRGQGISDISLSQETEGIAGTHAARPIDWFVYSSAVPKENPQHPELVFAAQNNITATKRDDFIVKLLEETGQRMVAIAGTHGKTTTTAMIIWLFKQLDVPVSYSVGGKLSYGEMGEFNPQAEFFVYEADEYDRNFLSFSPALSVIPGIAYDHPDIYPTESDYNQAFVDFVGQSKQTVIWQQDGAKIDARADEHVTLLDKDTDVSALGLPGIVNRMNAHAAIVAVEKLGLCDYAQGLAIMQRFPGVARRFEKVVDNVYTDYAHTPEKIEGALQLAHEVAGNNVVVVYEGLHNTRQHFIAKQLATLFTGIKKLIIVPSYLAREDEDLEMLTPEKLVNITQQPADRQPAQLDDMLKSTIEAAAANGDLVLCLSAGGGGSLDEWLKKAFQSA